MDNEVVLPEFPVDPRFLWDTRPAPEQQAKREFRAWYLARVLERGGIEDLRKIGLPTIEAWLPHLRLDPALRTYWDWYFSGRGTDTRAA